MFLFACRFEKKEVSTVNKQVWVMKRCSLLLIRSSVVATIDVCVLMGVQGVTTPIVGQISFSSSVKAKDSLSLSLSGE